MPTFPEGWDPGLPRSISAPSGPEIWAYANPPPPTPQALFLQERKPGHTDQTGAALSRKQVHELSLGAWPDAIQLLRPDAIQLLHEHLGVRCLGTTMGHSRLGKAGREERGKNFRRTRGKKKDAISPLQRPHEIPKSQHCERALSDSRSLFWRKGLGVDEEVPSTGF